MGNKYNTHSERTGTKAVHAIYKHIYIYVSIYIYRYIYIHILYFYLDRILVKFLKGSLTSFKSHCVFHLHTHKHFVTTLLY